MAIDWNSRSTRIVSFLLMLCTCAMPGCQSLRLPRIDPTGSSIFLPNDSTSLVGPGEGPIAAIAARHRAKGGCRLGLGCKQGCGLPSANPAFTSPIDPASCKPSKCERLKIHTMEKINNCINNEPGRAGSLMASPSVVLAPVGGEVVLLAGVCGKDGYLVKGQPIEWTVAPESVGHFVEVGDTRHLRFAGLGSIPKKITSTYATSTTSSHPQRITRGTPDPVDDIRLARGQGWATVTSPIEGTSHISIMAPQSKLWDQRRRTAVIHWVDAQWQIPRPIVAEIGAPQVLVTKVTRNRSQTPAKGWIVRYELVGGPPVVYTKGDYDSSAATLTNGSIMANGTQTIDIPVNDEGYAAVGVAQATNPGQPGTSQFNVTIIRPAETSGELAQLAVGSDTTSVQWVGAGLDIQVDGPQNVNAGNPIQYTVNVKNIGQIPAKNVVVSTTLPPNLRLRSSSAQEQVFGQQITWNLGELPAGATAPQLVVEFDATTSQTVDITFTAQGEGLTPTSGSRTTSIHAETLRVDLRPEQTTAFVGQEIPFEIDVTNLGNVPMASVLLYDELEFGLEEVSGEASPLRLNIGDIQPGETKTQGLVLVAKRAGVLRHRLTVTTNNGQGQQAVREATIQVQEAAAAPSKLQIEVDIPPQAKVGDQVTGVIRVTNVGDTPAKEYNVIATYPATLAPRQATGGRQEYPDRRQIVWASPVELVPQGSANGRSSFDFQVVFEATSADEVARFEAQVTAPQSEPKTAALNVRIEDGNAAGDTQLTPAPAGDTGLVPSATGNLELKITPLAAGGQVGQPIQHVVEVVNRRNANANDVVIAIQMPQGMKFNGTTGNIIKPPRLSPDGRTVYLDAFETLRMGESQQFRIEVVPDRPGPQRLVLTAKSRQTNEVQTSIDTNVTN